jgi:hypothetical protein
MNRDKPTHLMQMRWSRVARPAGLALLIAASAAWAANDLDTPNPRGTTHPDGSNTFNTEWLGHNDLQGRTTYQTTVHTQGRRVIAYAGHFNGQMLNPLTGVTETNGTSIVDVTDPRNPKYLKHLIADKGGARMAKLCDGNDLPHAVRGHTYLLRENGAVSHEWSERPGVVELFPGLSAPNRTCTLPRIRLSISSVAHSKDEISVTRFEDVGLFIA